MSLRKVIVLVGWGVLFGISTASGQSSSTLLGDLRAAYQRFDYDAAEAAAQAALAQYDEFSAGELIEIHTLYALIKSSRNEPVAARQQFVSALSLNPDLTLDPLLVSPKIMDFFEQVKRDVARERLEARTPSATRYVMVGDPRPAAALRSLLLPGWGQLYKGQDVKGYVAMGFWGAAVAGTVVAHLQRSQAEEAYLAAVDPAVIADRYDTFNTWNKVRNNLALGATAVWLYSFIDALVAEGVPPFQNGRLMVAPSPDPAAPEFSIQLAF